MILSYHLHKKHDDHPSANEHQKKKKKKKKKKRKHKTPLTPELKQEIRKKRLCVWGIAILILLGIFSLLYWLFADIFHLTASDITIRSIFKSTVQPAVGISFIGLTIFIALIFLLMTKNGKYTLFARNISTTWTLLFAIVCIGISEIVIFSALPKVTVMIIVPNTAIVLFCIAWFFLPRLAFVDTNIESIKRDIKHARKCKKSKDSKEIRGGVEYYTTLNDNGDIESGNSRHISSYSSSSDSSPRGARKIKWKT